MIIQAYTLTQVKINNSDCAKNRDKIAAAQMGALPNFGDPEAEQHSLEKKTVNFGNEIQQKLTPVLHHSCQELSREAERRFVQMLQSEGVAAELESQELCLLKQDYLSNLQQASMIEQRGRNHENNNNINDNNNSNNDDNDAEQPEKSSDEL